MVDEGDGAYHLWMSLDGQRGSSGRVVWRRLRRCGIVMATIAAGLLGACDGLSTGKDSAETPGSTTRPTTKVAEAKPAVEARPAVEFARVGPMAYFVASCQRCHGPHGSAYGETFGAHLSDEYLRETIKAMAEGPGASPLDDVGIAEQLRYHRAMIEKSPAIFVTERSGATLRGEVTPGAKVTARLADGSTVEAAVEGFTWKIDLAGVVEVVAEIGEKRMTWRPVSE
jgi:mono/diheme cytochrome c family protein